MLALEHPVSWDAVVQTPCSCCLLWLFGSSSLALAVCGSGGGKEVFRRRLPSPIGSRRRRRRRARLAGARPRSPRIGAAGRRRGHGRARCNRARWHGVLSGTGSSSRPNPYGQPSVASRCGRQLAPGNGRRRGVRLPPLGAPQRSACTRPPASAERHPPRRRSLAPESPSTTSVRAPGPIERPWLRAAAGRRVRALERRAADELVRFTGPLRSACAIELFDRARNIRRLGGLRG